MGSGLTVAGAKDNELQAVAGQLAGAESLVVVRDLMSRLSPDNLSYDHMHGSEILARGVMLVPTICSIPPTPCLNKLVSSCYSDLSATQAALQNPGGLKN